MRSMACTRIWHGLYVLHHHLLLMMAFDCPLAFRHKKGEYIFESTLFCFQGDRFLLVKACEISLDCI